MSRTSPGSDSGIKMAGKVSYRRGAVRNMEIKSNILEPVTLLPRGLECETLNRNVKKTLLCLP